MTGDATARATPHPPRRRRPPTRAQYAALGLELAAAIKNEQRANWRDAATYFRRAGSNDR